MILGPTFGNEVIAAGLGGLPFSWGSDGVFGESNLTQAQQASLNAVIAAHDHTKQLPAVITFQDLMALFTTAEQTAILDSSDLGVRLWLLKGSSAPEIDLGNPEVSQSLDYLISKSLLTADRKTQILSNTPLS
jgi:hypothetical protein